MSLNPPGRWVNPLNLCAKHKGSSGTHSPEEPFEGVLLFEDLYSRQSPHVDLDWLVVEV